MRRSQHVLLGGTFIGILSSLPVVNVANLCCCLWVVAGGVLTAYLQQQNEEAPLQTGDAAVGGLLAGLLGAVIHLVLTALITMGTGGLVDPEFQTMLEDNPQIPPEVRDMVFRMMTGRGFVVVLAAVSLPVYAVFATLGALLGVAIFRKKVAPPPPQP